MSPPKAGTNLHGLGEAYTAMFLAHNSFEWGGGGPVVPRVSNFPHECCAGGLLAQPSTLQCPLGCSPCRSMKLFDIFGAHLPYPTPGSPGQEGTGAPLAKPARAWGASGGTAREMGRCGAGPRDRVSSTRREHRTPTKRWVPHMERCLKGCFKRFLQWTEEEEDILDA